MKKIIRSLTLSIILTLVLSSCGFGSAATATEAPLFVMQSTAPASQLAVIELTVQPDTSVPYNTVGQKIKYNFTIKNTGTSGVAAGLPTDVTVTGATVTCPAITTVGNLDVSLDPTEALVCTSEYAITQADLDKGSVETTATAIVSGISSNPVTTTVTTVSSPLKLTKTANPVTYTHLGETITYSYVITNSGANPLGPGQFVVTDAGIPTPINCGDAALTLASNATVSCSGTYTVSQADVDAASIATNATASGPGASQSQAASVTVTKTVVAQTNPNAANLTAGSTIKYQVVAGDWLWQIARCYGADPQKVIDANPQIADPAQISPDTTVTVPNIGSAGKIYGPPCVGTHTVQSGDTWNSIALKYNADLTVLQMVNKNSLANGTLIKVPLNSAGISSPTGATGYCVDLTRPLKLAVYAAAITTHFNVCGTPDSATSGNMKIGTVKVYQRVEDVPGGTAVLSQDITLPASITTSTAINNATSLIVGDMNYDGNDDFRIVEFLPAGPNIPYVYYLYDPATKTFVYNESYRKITSPEFPGNAQIISKWRESATKWGIDTYTITNNTPILTQKETWEAIANTTNATHQITVYNADGTSNMTVNETIPMPLQP
jgi:LysM repeat protein